MKGEKRERWIELARMAIEEQDPVRLMRLVEEINELLQEKEDRLKKTYARQREAESESAERG